MLRNVLFNWDLEIAAFYGQCTRKSRQRLGQGRVCVAQVSLLVLPGLEFEARLRGANKWSIYQPAIRAYPSYALILRAVITNQYYTALMRRITRNVGERVL